MKNLTKLVVVGIFALFTIGLFINKTLTRVNTTVSAQTQPTPPETNANTNANATSPAGNVNTDVNGNAIIGNANVNSGNSNFDVGNTNLNAGNTEPSDKKLPKELTLGQESQDIHGEVEFNHETHAFEKYSPDGKSVVGCVECHHTDQPKSALKPPLITSERDVILTLVTWQKSSQKVSECRSCHFQDGEAPDDKEIPIYTKDDKEIELNNENAYHINCNTCHDAAAELRPELKKTKGFATADDCMVCHKEI